MTFTTIDIIFASLVLILVVRCTLRGFVEEFMSMAAILIGVLLAVFFFQRGGAFLTERFGIKILPGLIAFVALFAIGFVIIKILERILADIVERIRLGSVNRLLGLVLGLVEGLLVVSIVLYILNVQPLFDASALLRGSIFAQYLLPLVGEINLSPSSVTGAL